MQSYVTSRTISNKRSTLRSIINLIVFGPLTVTFCWSAGELCRSREKRFIILWLSSQCDRIKINAGLISCLLYNRTGSSSSRRAAATSSGRPCLRWRHMKADWRHKPHCQLLKQSWLISTDNEILPAKQHINQLIDCIMLIEK